MNTTTAQTSSPPSQEPGMLAGHGVVRGHVVAAVGVLRTRLAESWALAALASAGHLSRSQLVRSFDATVGTSPMAYLRLMRVERLARLLASTDLSVAEAARSVGWKTSFTPASASTPTTAYRRPGHAGLAGVVAEQRFGTSSGCVRPSRRGLPFRTDYPPYRKFPARSAPREQPTRGTPDAETTSPRRPGRCVGRLLPAGLHQGTGPTRRPRRGILAARAARGEPAQGRKPERGDRGGVHRAWRVRHHHRPPRPPTPPRLRQDQPGCVLHRPQG